MTMTIIIIKMTTMILLRVSMESLLSVLCAKFRHVQFQPQARPAAIAGIIGGNRIAMEKVLSKGHQSVGLGEHGKIQQGLTRISNECLLCQLVLTLVIVKRVLLFAIPLIAVWFCCSYLCAAESGVRTPGDCSLACKWSFARLRHPAAVNILLKPQTSTAT